MIRDYELTLRGLRIHAQSAGEGVPILLHSGIFSEMHHWGPLIEHLHGCRVITYDAPGIAPPRCRHPRCRCGPGGHRRGRPGSPGPGFRPRPGGVVRRRGRPADGPVPPRAGRQADPGVHLVRRASHARRLSSLLRMMHPRGYHPDRLAKSAGAMFGGRMRTEPELAADLKMSKPGSLQAALFRLSALAGGPACTACHRSGTRRWSCAGTTTR